MVPFPRPWRVIGDRAYNRTQIVDKHGRSVAWVNKGLADSPRQVAEFIVEAVNAMPDI